MGIMCNILEFEGYLIQINQQRSDCNHDMFSKCKLGFIKYISESMDIIISWLR